MSDNLAKRYQWILRWLNTNSYLEVNPDLRAIVKEGSEQEVLEQHFRYTGFFEKRIYNTQLIRFFCSQYYADSTKQDRALSEYALKQHWLYEGIFERGSPNAVTAKALSSQVQVYNMGRVGSYSVVRALYGIGLDNVIHTHTNYEFKMSHPKSTLTFEQLCEIKANFNCWPKPIFISGIRDPYKWALSAIKRSVYTGDIRKPDAEAEVISACRKLFLQCINWFEHRYHADIDVYSHEFNSDDGYAIIEKDDVVVAIYDVSKLDAALPEIAKVIFDRKLLRIEKVNATENDKTFGAFVDSCLRGNDELNALLKESKYWKHFFEK